MKAKRDRGVSSPRMAATRMITLAAVAAALTPATPPGIPANAQTAEEDSVLRRPRPDYDARCLDLDGAGAAGNGPGVFRLCPSVTTSGGYSDNVLRTETGEEADAFVVVEPSLTLEADGETLDLSLSAHGAVTRYSALSRNNSDDYAARAAGRLDVTDDLTVAAEGSFGRFHEDRESPDAASALLDVTEFTLGREQLRFEYRPVDWLLRVTGEARQFDFSDTGAVDNDDRDRDEYELTVRVGREFQPGLTLFVEPVYNIRRYRNVPDSAGVNRDSEGFEVRAGATYDLTGVTFLELSGGIFRQRFEDPSFGDEQGFSVKGRLLWNPTDVTTVTAEVGRAVRESTLAGVSGVVETDIAVGLDYEVRDYLLLSGRGSYRNSDFGSGGRTDDTYRGSVALTGLINEYMSLTTRYEYAERSSDAVGEDFRSNTFLLSLGLRF